MSTIRPSFQGDAGVLPKISVVIPAHNVEAYIGAALQSLSRQTVAPHEVVVVDDGSTDRTAAVVRGFSERGLGPRLRQQANLGVSVARNVGLADVTGQYVIFLDADDWLAPQALAKISTAATSGPDVIHWRFTQVDESGASTGAFETGWPSEWPEDPWEMLSGLLNRNLQWLWIGATAWRTQFLSQHQLRFAEGCATAEDSEFMWTALSVATRTAFVNEQLSWYLARTGSVTRAVDLRLFDGCQAYLRLAKRLENSAHKGAEVLVRALRISAVERYFLTVSDLTTSVPRPSLAREMELRCPGLTHEIREVLRSEAARGVRLSKTHLAALRTCGGGGATRRVRLVG